MRSGPIRAEVRTRDLDRRDVSLAMWEQGEAAVPDLPWAAASSLGAQEVAALLSTCRTAVLAVGRTQTATALLGHVLASVPASCRLYLYGPRTLETDGSLRQRLGALSDRVLPRLGSDVPADWLVLDSGRAALLLIGPPGGERRWLVRADGPLARTLFEACRVLFWFHATREGLPDSGGTLAFHTPLPAPFPDPGNDVALPAGRLAIGGSLPDPIADAEIRIAPGGAVPGRAGIVFLPPDARDFASPARLARGMTRVVWLDIGLPETSVSRERLVFDLVAEPVALQLEWPRKDAIDLYHRLSGCARKPAWQFHAQRRLADVKGRVLLEGAATAAEVTDAVVVQAPDVIAELTAFDGVQPDEIPAPPLARRVTYRWSVRPRTLPAGARAAELVRRWRNVDEWARRQVDTLRQALAGLPGHDELRPRRSLLLDQLDELGEALPSQRFADARDRVRRIAEAGREIRDMLEHAHRARIEAEDATAEVAQRAAWTARTQRAAEELAAKRVELAALEAAEATAIAALEEAEKSQKPAEVKAARKERAKEQERTREALRRISTEIRAREQRASEPFTFQPPPRPPGAALPPEAPAPPVPDEELPEPGELFEHQGTRYLAVKTWSQVPRAVPVARRLRSELVSSSDHPE